MEKIAAKEKSVKEILQNNHYEVDYYQRDYKWQEKHVNELLTDLIDAFYEHYKESDPRTEVSKYGSYFLGSIIICNKDGKKYIVDGQQRLTTITLLLIYIYHRLKENNFEDQFSKIHSLILSDVFGQKTFNMSIEERNKCMEKILKGEEFSNNNGNISESEENLYSRYEDILEFDELKEMDEKKFLYFSDWLIEKVYFVEITTEGEEDAYRIFETMNDRGLSLTPVEMLKGYMLTRISDLDKRKEATSRWETLVEELRKKEKDLDADAFKVFLRSKYAETIRERKVAAEPKDFDKIGTEFHRWVKDNEEELGLKEGDDFYNFITHDLSFYFKEYQKIKDAELHQAEGLVPIFYNSCLEFTLQDILLLAPILREDSQDVIRRKFYLTSTFLDILLVRRIWNFKSISYSTMNYFIFITAKAIRNKSTDELGDILKKILEDKIREDDLSFSNSFYLNQRNKKFAKYILARITDFVETQSGNSSKFEEYIAKRSKYEIEHVLAHSFEQYKENFTSETEFEEYRNKLGALLLLPKSFNASYGALPYEEKLEYYFGQNLLAKSLHPKCYEHNPGFITFINNNNLPFRPYEKYNKQAIEERQELQSKIAELIWSSEKLKENREVRV